MFLSVLDSCPSICLPLLLPQCPTPPAGTFPTTPTAFEQSSTLCGEPWKNALVRSELARTLCIAQAAASMSSTTKPVIGNQ